MTKQERFMQSLKPTEQVMFENMVMSFMGKAYDEGIRLTSDQVGRCAAHKIDTMRRKGLKAAISMKIGSVPPEWPDVEEVPVVEKKTRVKRTPDGETEADIQRAISKALVKMGWLVIRINSGAQKIGDRYFRANIIENNGRSDGFPDLQAFKGARVLLLEVKAAKGSLSEGQRHFRDLAQTFNVPVHVVRSVDDVLKLVG